MHDWYALCGVLIIGIVLLGVAGQVPRVAWFAPDTPPVVLPTADLHALETFPDSGQPFRWSMPRSELRLPATGAGGTVRLALAGGTRVVPATLTVGGGTPLPLLVAPDRRVYTVLAPGATGERLTVQLASTTVFADGRDLGVMVAGGGTSGHGIPLVVSVSLLAAIAVGYTLLRHAGSPPRTAAGLAVGVLLLALVVYLVGGWQYALAAPLAGLVALAAGAGVVLHRCCALRAPAVAVLPRALHGGAWVWLVGVLLAGLLVRLPWLLAADPVGDLELAARRMGLLYTEGLAGAYLYDGDYMPLRLLMLWLSSQLVAVFGGGFTAPLDGVTLLAIKTPALLADAATTALIFWWAQQYVTLRQAAGLAALYTLAPPIWINVAWWGQVDALLLLPLLLMVLLLDRHRGRWAWLCWAVALLIKPQAIVFAPLVYLATVRLHGARGLVQGGSIAVGVIALGSLPLVLAGQTAGLLQAALGSVGRFPQLTAGAYNLWYLVTGGVVAHDTGQGIGGVSYRLLGVLLVGAVALLCSSTLVRRADLAQRLAVAAMLALAFFALPTQIHERYLFLSLVFVLLYALWQRRWLLAFVALASSATLNILGTLDGFVAVATAVLAASPLPWLLAGANLLVLLWLLTDTLRAAWATPHTREAAVPSTALLK